MTALAWDGYICRRCGETYMVCVHTNTHDRGISEAHAERIKARYALGRQFDPDNHDNHDTNDYYTDPPGGERGVNDFIKNARVS